MITTDLVYIALAGTRQRSTLDPRGRPITRERGEKWLAEYGNREPPGGWHLDPVVTCGCCGSPDVGQTRDDQHRCDRHRGRNPCAIEGCKRTTEAPESGTLRDDQWICGTHWKRLVPPRSARRRAYHAFFRRAKRRGWDDDLRRRFWQFWNSLIASARRRAAVGYLDERAIDRLFGFDEGGG